MEVAGVVAAERDIFIPGAFPHFLSQIPITSTTFDVIANFQSLRQSHSFGFVFGLSD